MKNTPSDDLDNLLQVNERENINVSSNSIVSDHPRFSLTENSNKRDRVIYALSVLVNIDELNVL